MPRVQRIRGLGTVKPHVKAAAEEIASKFNVWHIGGFATSGHITNSDHYTGHALDVMTETDMSKGQKVADWTQANTNRLSVKYIIWNRRIWEPDTGWKAYFGSSPHTDHVHISFNKTPGDGSAFVDDYAGEDDSGYPQWFQLFIDWFFGKR